MCCACWASTGLRPWNCRSRNNPLMIPTGVIKVLLVEDDEDDAIIARDLFSEIQSQRFVVDWASSFQAGLEAMQLNQHDVCLVDYRLGAQNGVELLREAQEHGCQAPVILLTGAGEAKVDHEAMEAGAADYLVKTKLQANSLERSIRYALQRKRAAVLAAFEQARLAAFGAEIGLALTSRDSLDAILDRCSKAMAQFLNAALAQISTFDARKQVFETRAAAGPIWEGASAPRQAPVVKLELTALSEGKPMILKQLANDPHLPDQEWVKKEGVVSYAAFPLMLENKLVGLMTIFTQQPLTEKIALEMSSVAHGIALSIDRKRSEEALGVSEVKYRSVVESIKEVIFQLDEFGHWTFLNSAWTAVTGFEVEPTLGTLFLEYISQEDRQQNQEIFLKLIERKLDYCRYETRFLTKNGKVRWVEVYSQLALNGDGTVRGASGSLTDVTDRKLAETQIQKLAAFPRVNPNPVLELSKEGTLTYANDAAREMAKSLGRNQLLSILPPDAAGMARDCLSTGRKRLREEVSVNGRTLVWSFFPVPASHVVHCYGVDVTDVLNLEAQLRHAQKLESVGQLAAGVAHDINNLLTVIQGYSDCLRARCQGDRVTEGALKQISEASQRATALTRQLLMFSSKQVIAPKVLDLNSVLQNLANMLRRLLGEDVVLESNYDRNAVRIEADTGMLEQVVMNLAVNARDAMPKGGQLYIGTGMVEISEDYVKQHPGARTGSFACLTVTDTGCGMDRKTLDRIFEPFFTTKGAGKGTGLGLATVYGIVKQHKGWIDVTSQVGAGTTFKIYFPVAAQPVERATDTHTAGKPVRGGKETILLVEDEKALRELVREVLRSYDYRVIEAASGVEALRVWDEHDGEIDLLFTDMVMPEGLTGSDLAAQLKQRKPELKVIFTSGYSPEVLGREFGPEDTAFLSKPYLPPQLGQLVRQCLDSARKPCPDLVPA